MRAGFFGQERQERKGRTAGIFRRLAMSEAVDVVIVGAESVVESVVLPWPLLGRTPTKGVPGPSHAGGGHAGLATAAQLKHTGVTCVVLEGSPRVGNSWWKRCVAAFVHVQMISGTPQQVPTATGKHLLCLGVRAATTACTCTRPRS